MIFLVDFIFLAVLFTLVTGLTQLLEDKATDVMQGKTPNEIQEILLKATAEQSLAYVTELQYFVIFAVVGIFLLLLFSFLTFGLTQALIWHHLLEKKFEFKKHWRWDALHVVLFIPALFYVLCYVIVAFIAALLINGFWQVFSTFYFQYTSFADGLQSFVSGMIQFCFIVFGGILLFLIYYTFTKEYKVWKSIGDTFSLIKSKWKRLVVVFLFSVLTSSVLALIMLPLRRMLENFSVIAMALDLAVIVLFLAWLRIYLVSSLEEN